MVLLNAYRRNAWQGTTDISLLDNFGMAESRLPKHITKFAIRAGCITETGNSGISLTIADMRYQVSKEVVLRVDASVFDGIVTLNPLMS